MKQSIKISSVKITKSQLLFYCSTLLVFLIITIVLSILKNPNCSLFFLLSFFPFVGVFVCLYKMEWWIITEKTIIVRNIFQIIKTLQADCIDDVKIVSLNFDRTTSAKMYVINDSLGQYNLVSSEINPSKYPEYNRPNAYNKKNGPMLIPVNEITSEFFRKYIES